jgi:hypothetical protein
VGTNENSAQDTEAFDGELSDEALDRTDHLFCVSNKRN